MRKSAAQIIFQMQKSQICTVHKNTNANFCTCHNFSEMQINFCTNENFVVQINFRDKFFSQFF